MTLFYGRDSVTGLLTAVRSPRPRLATSPPLARYPLRLSHQPLVSMIRSASDRINSILANRCGERGIRSLQLQYRFPIFLKLTTFTSRKYGRTFSNPQALLSPTCDARILATPIFCAVTAERGGFEPPRGLLPCYLSKVVHSTALPSLHNVK